MYEYLSGKLVDKSPTHVVIDVGGIGYHVHISLHTYAQIKDTDQGKLYISFQVREDAHTLYGFAEAGERSLFEHLISVSGIGPNTGRMILSSITPDEIQSAIINGNVPLIQRIKGIGPKTAQRMVLELQDKLKKQGPDALTAVHRQQTVPEEALSALVMLGFVRAQAEKVLSNIIQGSPNLSVESLIKEALKKL
ncbi:holliday junction DNA helicase RuvA [Parapedobacter composti]|uniref:Holliday junction branch migration complex subunit RuvA n=1 Tax=Parapedobacter composti TaxID=623281 RepID=A0A1I1EC19_9SPHI|nr:Holliday junction branch migration protein RuvA [Parapedobacter composti]SFB82483.1 holliday junction DNA helicase RuvA [Parapedobacter composti]